jgi:Replication-relaxation
MPSSRRTKLTHRDIDVLRFLSSVGFATVDQVQRRYAISEGRMYRVLARLTRAELVWRDRPLTGIKGVFGVTKLGAHAAGVRPGPSEWSWRNWQHELGVVDLVNLHSADEAGLCRFWTERDLIALQVEAGTPRHQREHLPDLILQLGDGTVAAVELELTAKNAERLRAIMRSYLGRSGIDSVIYYAPEGRIPRLETTAAEVGGSELFAFRVWPVAP